MSFRCIGCGANKLPAEFYPCTSKKSKRGHEARCKACWNARDKAWRQNNAVSAKGYRERYKKNNRDRIAALTRKSALKQRYGITPDQYDAMMLNQGGCCAICKTASGTRRKLCVDHCHQTGKVRALLCDKCNSGIGAFKDDPALMIRAAEFVMAYMEAR
jgi:hypothetical protein